MRVAFQGAAGAYSEEAALRYFGAAVAPVPCRDFAAVADAVVAGRVAWGILPVENSIAGRVEGACAVLAAGTLAAVGEVVLPIHHCLLGLPGAQVAALAQIASHPMALAQCTRFLAARPGTRAVAAYDTAGAARAVAAGSDASVAAIASRRAAARYGLEVLAADIEDRPDNQTRFVVVAAAAGGRRT